MTSYRRYSDKNISIAHLSSDSPGIEPEGESEEGHSHAKHRDNSNKASMVEVVIVHQRW